MHSPILVCAGLVASVAAIGAFHPQEGAVSAESFMGLRTPITPISAPVHHPPGWERHVAACSARYRTYNPDTDQFMRTPGQPQRCALAPPSDGEIAAADTFAHPS